MCRAHNGTIDSLSRNSFHTCTRFGVSMQYRSNCKPSDTLLKDPDKKSFSIFFSSSSRRWRPRQGFFLFPLSSVLLKSVRDMHCLLFCGSSTRWSKTTSSNCVADRRRQLALPTVLRTCLMTTIWSSWVVTWI